VAYSADARLLASGGAAGGVWLWHAATGKQAGFLRTFGTVGSLAFSPDGGRLAVATSSRVTVNRVATAWRSGAVTVWDVAARRAVLHPAGPVRTGPAVVRGRLQTVTYAVPFGHVTFSPDGKELWAANPKQALSDDPEDGAVTVWDARTGNKLRTVPVRYEGCGLAYSPDGKYIAVGRRDGGVRVREARTGRERLHLHAHARRVYAVAFSPDGGRLAASGEGVVKVWDTATGRDRATARELFTLRGHGNWFRNLAFSPDGRTLASAGADGPALASAGDAAVRLWDAVAGQGPRALPFLARGVAGLALSGDGRRLASVSNPPSFPGRKGDGVVTVWDAKAGKGTSTGKGHAGRIRRVAFSADGSRLASAGEDGTVRVWHADKGQETLALKGHTGPVAAVAFSPDGRLLASGGQDGVKVWDAATGKELLAPKGHTGPVSDVAFSPDGRLLASASFDKTVRVWEVPGGRPVLCFAGHSGRVNRVAFSPGGGRCASAGADGTVRVWAAATGGELFPPQVLAGSVVSLTFSPDGQRLASSIEFYDTDRPGQVSVWDAATGVEVLTLENPPGHGLFGDLAFSPDGHRLFATSAGAVKFWDATPLAP
jgi:WD40 repeat protein